MTYLVWSIVLAFLGLTGALNAFPGDGVAIGAPQMSLGLLLVGVVTVLWAWLSLRQMRALGLRRRWLAAPLASWLGAFLFCWSVFPHFSREDEENQYFVLTSYAFVFAAIVWLAFVILMMAAWERRRVRCATAPPPLVE